MSSRIQEQTRQHSTITVENGSRSAHGVKLKGLVEENPPAGPVAQQLLDVLQDRSTTPTNRRPMRPGPGRGPSPPGARRQRQRCNNLGGGGILLAPVKVADEQLGKLYRLASNLSAIRCGQIESSLFIAASAPAVLAGSAAVVQIPASPNPGPQWVQGRRLKRVP
ncbi:hypothetical protein CC78DRAFT_575425 [Lojkania enalia]|uniref:Uncharacterized protein n=1 Tax=Lojkania enalia TaxID=147567 RepID=A0A9P4N996_9PLEO|nr:hypothetical protein CC78DRAFT_575425 [Didymosphaeria enalia]